MYLVSSSHGMPNLLEVKTPRDSVGPARLARLHSPGTSGGGGTLDHDAFYVLARARARPLGRWLGRIG